MKGKSVLMLAVALGCGLVAMLGVQQVLSGDKKQEKEVKTGQVLVAVQEISPGIPIDDAMTTFKEMPVELIPSDAVTKPEEFADRALRVKAFPGTPILKAMLGEQGEFGVSSDIPQGMRVVAISVTATSAVAGFVKPGDRIDIQVTYKVREKGQYKSRTKTILEYIEVFAADKTREMVDSENDSIYKNLSVLVTPEQANIIRLAGSKGSLDLSLRHPDDEEHTQIADITEDDLLGQPSLFGEDGMPITENQEGDEIAASGENDLRSLINKETADTATPVEEEPVEEKEEPKQPETWTIVIYSGDEKNVEVIELEEEDSEDEEAVEATSAEPAAT